MSLYKNGGKRVLDLIVSVALLILLSPVMLLVAAIVRIALGSPVLFKQERPGLAGVPFMLYKFRTMSQARGADGAELPDGMRLTRVGRWLRKSSLDELPQLWNVARGDMSLVGPRPLLMEYLPLYSANQARRHEVRPGITGWTQVSGRNALLWDEKFALDVWYVEHESFALDMKIAALTALRLVRPHGISAPGADTMPKFTGTRKA
jgi:sugar transferase EpsL